MAGGLASLDHVCSSRRYPCRSSIITREAVATSNPYQSPQRRSDERAATKPRPRLRAAIIGAILSVSSVFPITALMALFFRFPVPFAGIEGGLAQVLPALVGLLFYGVFMGGFLVVAVCGALAGTLAQFVSRTERQRRQLQRWLPIAATLMLLFILATLDWYIGPW